MPTQMKPGYNNLLVSWYFEPSQPQRITSELKQTSVCLLFTLRSSKHKFPKNHKISPDTNLQKTNHTQTSNTIFFKELVRPVSPPLKTHLRLGHAGNMDHSVNWSTTRFKTNRWGKEMPLWRKRQSKLICPLQKESQTILHSSHWFKNS